MEKDVINLIENIKEFMDIASVRNTLIEKYGEDSRFVDKLRDNEAIDELAACISDEDAEYKAKFPHLYQAPLADGSTIDADGTIHHHPYAELRAMGYSAESLRPMSDDEVYEEWCRVKGYPLSDDYIKAKAKENKDSLIDLGFSSLKDIRFK